MLLSSIIGGSSVSLSLTRASHTDNKHLPVYSSNTESQSRAGKLSDAGAVPALVSHFLGDGSEPFNADNEIVLSHFPSRFLDDQSASILYVDNFDIDKSEESSGSPNFYLEDKSAQLLSQRAKTVSSKTLKSTSQTGEHILNVNAVKDGKDYNEFILNLAHGIKDAKMMVIGRPFNEKPKQEAYGNRRRESSEDDHKESPYVQIPSLFNSEDECVAKTNSCSSHGSCMKTSSGNYACRCTSTKVGDYTYYWGGNDCSKRDVSFQFNLIVGVTLAIIVAAALSVKLLFNLGSEPLPGSLNVTSI